jgi:Cu/Ag efflux protein CusF
LRRFPPAGPASDRVRHSRLPDGDPVPGLALDQPAQDSAQVTSGAAFLRCSAAFSNHHRKRDDAAIIHHRACRAPAGDPIMLMHRLLLSAILSMPLALPLAALAQGNPAAPGEARASAPGATWTEGLVRSIHRKDGQITISHEPLANLGMGKMTMTFRLQSVALIDGIKEGSRIRFVAENVKGELTVVALQPVE